MKKSLLTITLCASLSLTACSTVMDYMPWVYTIDIKQGNIIDQDMINQLRPNMSKRQVLYIMGSPMLNDYFNKQRWDYVYSTREDGDQTIKKHATLFFNGDELVKIEGDFKPSDKPVAKRDSQSTIDILPRNLDQTLWEKFTSLFDESDNVSLEGRDLRNESNNIPVDKF